MFLLRSAFWLTVAFMVIRPGMDLRDGAEAISAAAQAAGQQIVITGVAASSCIYLQCSQEQPAPAPPATTIPPVAVTMQATPGPVPFPRPRPDWMV